MARAIMIQGTMSNAGKSLIATGLCRIFRQDGYRVAPFKSQNMALNSYITRENLEMGRAQAAQAEACGVEPSVRMNPILLKPTTDMGSQVIINGEVIGNMHAVDYYKKKREYIPVVREAYESLATEYDIVVIEGAGSPAEINLKQDDIVNMGMAEIADAPVLLVGDIDRGGVFAQLLGTILLLEPQEQERICGLIINKFRGDRSILEPGLAMLEERCHKKVLGVVPYANVDIEEEDSLAESLGKRRGMGAVDVVVIRLPRISNFTDFQAFALEEDVTVRYVERVSELGQPDAIVLPGTKNTIKDMRWLRKSGLERAVVRCCQRGSVIMGICGGYQMLGESIRDEHVSEDSGEIRAMGLLPMKTCFEAEKTRTRVTGCIHPLSGELSELSGRQVSGYEIHMGQSALEENACTLQTLENIFSEGEETATKLDGCCQGHVLGTYLHGIFDEEDFRSAFVRMLCQRKGISYRSGETLTYQEYKEQQFEHLAEVLRENLDMEEVYRAMGMK